MVVSLRTAVDRRVSYVIFTTHGTYPRCRQAVNNCSLALKIDAESSKALYRRAYALVAKKDHDGAKADLLEAQKHAPADKAVATLLRKVCA